MFVTTLNKIRNHNPCQGMWVHLLKHLGKTEADDEPLSLLTILEFNGLDDALWCCRAVEGHDKDFRLFAVWCARQVQHQMTDECSLHALDVAERHANGLASDEELIIARAAAWDATWYAAGDAAWRTARAAAGDAAWRTARAVAWDPVCGVAWGVQEARFRQMLAEGAFIGSTARETCAA